MKAQGTTRWLAVVLAVSAILVRPAAAEIIDRVIAVVSGQIVTQSDLATATAFGLAGSLDEMIDRTLMLNEVRRVAPPDPEAAAVDARVAQMRRRFTSTDAWSAALAAGGIDDGAVRVYAADDLLVSAYLDDRFSGAAQPSDEEIRQATVEHPDWTQEQARMRLQSERRQTLVASWVAELRRRADITVF